MMMLNNMDRKKKKNANANNNIPIPRTHPRSIQPMIPQSSPRPSRGIGEHNAHHPKQRQCSRMGSSKTAAASMICWHPMPLMLLLLLQLFLMLLCPLGVVGRLLDTSVACDQHNFILSLNFDAPFRGLVYTEEGFPNCIYVNGTMLSHLSYQLKIPLHGCETRTNADGNFENGIIIQENVAFLQATDKKYLLTCIPSSAGGGASSTSTPPPESVPPTTRQPSPPPTTTSAAATVEHRTTSSSSGGLQKLPFFPSISSSSSSSSSSTLPPALGAGEHAFGRENAVTVDFGGVTVDQSLTSPVSVRGTLPPSLSAEADQQNQQQQQLPPPAAVPELKYTVEIRAGHALDAGPISAALNIGDPISYVVRLQKPVSESQIGRCWASDSKSSLELSDEHGCSLQPRGNIWSQFERVELPTELTFVNRIKAWAFPTSNEVNIFCNLRVCMSRHCSFATNCSDAATNQPNERRRREEDGGGGGGGGGFEEIETLKTSIRFRRHSTPKAAGAAEGGEGGQQRKMEFSSLRTAYPELFEEPESWCLTLSQLLLVAASCCLASACLTVGASFLLFNLCCCNRRGDKLLLGMGGGGSRLGRLLLLSRGQNGEKRAAAAAATEVDVWAMINELKRRNQKQQQQMPEAATTAGERRRQQQQQQQQNPPPQHQTSSSRHAI